MSANVVAMLGESLGTFAGPLAAGLVIAGLGPGPTAALASVAFVVAALFALRVRIADAAKVAPAERTVAAPILLGLRTLVARPALGAVLVSFQLQVIVRGALTTLTVVLALEVLRAGETSVGLLNAALGVGGVVGAIAGLWLTRRSSLSRVFAVALAGWGLPIAVAGGAPVIGVALVAMVVVGLSNSLLDVAGFTLLQRGAPNQSRAAVFAVNEAMIGLTFSFGALLAPVLAEQIAVTGALIAIGVVLPVAALVGHSLIRRLDREGVVPEERAGLLRGIPPFALLPLAGLERLAAGMTPAHFAVGKALMREGERGDRYFVIESGSVLVTAGDRELRRQGPGEGTGDIALLRRVPRTATVTALEPVEAFAIDCDTFLAAVSGHTGSAAVAEEIVTERLRASASA